MGLINEKDAAALAKVFGSLTGAVQLVFFTQEHECQFCTTTRQILEELAALSGKLSLKVYDFVGAPDEVRRYGIDKLPATVLLGADGRDYGIRFYGVPAGYEFTALIEDIVDVGRGKPDLPEGVQPALSTIDRPVHLQVAVSPTCPYCPQALRNAHKLAMASEHIRADMLEISEFPHLAVKYGVQGVPHTIINEKHSVVGAVPIGELIHEIQNAIGQAAAK